jgi:hypothetical protein
MPVASDGFGQADDFAFSTALWRLAVSRMTKRLID